MFSYNQVMKKFLWIIFLFTLLNSNANSEVRIDIADTLYDKIFSCWKPASMKSMVVNPWNPEKIKGINIKLEIFFNPDGTVKKIKHINKLEMIKIFSSTGNPARYDNWKKNIITSAKSAIKKCQPYNLLPKEYYEAWNVITVYLDPVERLKGKEKITDETISAKKELLQKFLDIGADVPGLNYVKAEEEKERNKVEKLAKEKKAKEEPKLVVKKEPKNTVANAKLDRLLDLYMNGALTKEEFEKAKKKLLLEIKTEEEKERNKVEKLAKEKKAKEEKAKEEKKLAEEKKKKEKKIISASSGTGFFISKEGHIISNNHVVDVCHSVKIHHKGKIEIANIISRDRTNDLALLQINFQPNEIFGISNIDASLLEDVYVAGYPFGKSVSSSIKVTKGVISGLSGLGDNYANLQIDAALQPGNSGGPIIDEYGNVVGVAVSKLDFKQSLKTFGAIPENTNFGVKSSVVKSFTNANLINLIEINNEEISKQDIGKKILDATVYVDCWMTIAKIEEMKTMKTFFPNLDLN